MAATGITPTDEVRQLLGDKDFDYAQKHENGVFDKRYPYKYIVFKISDDKKHVVLDRKKLNSVGEHEMSGIPASELRARCLADYEEMVRDLPESEGRYIVYTLAKKNCTFERAFLFWVGKKANIKNKFVYASTKLSLTDQFLKGVKASLKNVQIGDFSYPEELNEEYVFGYQEKPSY